MGKGDGGRHKREGIYVYIAVQHKLTQHCEAIILQFLKNDNKNKITTRWCGVFQWVRYTGPSVSSLFAPFSVCASLFSSDVNHKAEINGPHLS